MLISEAKMVQENIPSDDELPQGLPHMIEPDPDAGNVNTLLAKGQVKIEPTGFETLQSQFGEEECHVCKGTNTYGPECNECWQKLKKHKKIRPVPALLKTLHDLKKCLQNINTCPDCKQLYFNFDQDVHIIICEAMGQKVVSGHDASIESQWCNKLL